MASVTFHMEISARQTFQIIHKLISHEKNVTVRWLPMLVVRLTLIQEKLISSGVDPGFIACSNKYKENMGCCRQRKQLSKIKLSTRTLQIFDIIVKIMFINIH